MFTTNSLFCLTGFFLCPVYSFLSSWSTARTGRVWSILHVSLLYTAASEKILVDDKVDEIKTTKIIETKNKLLPNKNKLTMIQIKPVSNQIKGFFCTDLNMDHVSNKSCSQSTESELEPFLSVFAKNRKSLVII